MAKNNDTKGAKDSGDDSDAVNQHKKLAMGKDVKTGGKTGGKKTTSW
jgi:hypothetical protein